MAETLDQGLVRGLITLATLAAFLGVCWWAYRPKNRARFERDARIPFPERHVGEQDGAGDGGEDRDPEAAGPETGATERRDRSDGSGREDGERR